MYLLIVSPLFFISRKEWRADGVAFPRPPSAEVRAGIKSFGDKGHDYQRARDDSSDVNSKLVAVVDELLAKRLTLRLSGDFAAADRLRDALAQNHNIFVDDMKKVWRADGKHSGQGGREAGFRKRGGVSRGRERPGREKPTWKASREKSQKRQPRQPGIRGTGGPTWKDELRDSDDWQKPV